MPAHPDDRTPSSRGGDGSSGESGPISVQRAIGPDAEPLGAHRHSDTHAIRSGQGQALETARYTEREVIAVGGSSVVVRAYDKDIFRDVAIKILDPARTSDGSEVNRFAEEARINGQLEHPSIVPIYELGVDQLGRQFLCMKLVRGETLEETLHRLGDRRLEPVHLAEHLQVFVKVCDAVSFAHSRAVLHRDLKPRNIMLSDFGQVYVLDWGIARLRARGAAHEGPPVRVSAGEGEHSELDPPGSLVGTAYYMAPEQLRGKHDELDERADVFALGATLYQVLTGQPPLTPEMVRAIWIGKDMPAIAPPERLASTGSVPPELSRIAMKAIALDAGKRYASVADLKRDIEAFQRGAWDLPRVRFPAGAIILREGEPGDSAHVVVEGRCIAYRGSGEEEVVLRVMGPGEVFGETAVFSHKPRSASVKAATDVVLTVVTGEVLSKALGLNSWMGAFVKALADRFREADERLRDLLAPGRSWPRRAAHAPSLAEDTDKATTAAGAELLQAIASPDSAASALPRIAFPAGSVIVVEGEPGDAAYVVLKGRCAAYRGEGASESEVRALGPGDVFGETSVWSGKPRTASVRATTDVVVLSVARDVFSAAAGLDSWMGIFVKALAERFRETEERLVEVGGQAAGVAFGANK